MHLPTREHISISLTCTDLERRITIGLGIAVLAFAACYSYFVTSSIMNVVIQKDLQQHTAAVRTDIGTLESRYLKAQHAIDRQYAAAEGYVQAPTSYVTRDSLARTTQVGN